MVVNVESLVGDVIACFHAWGLRPPGADRDAIRTEGKALEQRIHRWYPTFRASDPSTYPVFPRRLIAAPRKPRSDASV